VLVAGDLREPAGQGAQTTIHSSTGVDCR
jgi:hypothetical protein